MKTAIAFSILLVLAGCGGGTAADNAADQLEDAAEMSNPAAAPVMENGADAIREQEGGNAGAAAQNVLQDAGNAQAR
ncbi:MAG TPA: hypothetical protein VD887_11485 [Allosphingosinicella sp.]|nr:hypothetical protein [Allosphingosinicella sp.]